MLFRMSILAIATCSLALTACSNKNEKKVVKKVDTNAIMADTSMTRVEKAEQLALAAEQLVSPGSFMYAQEVVDQSLKIDKNNKRAQLVDALIAPMMTTKGIMARVKPLADKTEEGKAEYAETLAKLEEQPSHAIKTFLLEGQANIQNEKDIQNFIDSVRNAFNKQRLFFKNNKDLEMTFNIADIFSATALSKDDACYWVESEEGAYEEYCEEDKEPALLSYKLNRADNESFQQAAAGAQIYLSLLNAYNLSGAIDVALANKDVMDTDDKLIREELLKNSSFGTLRTSAALSNIRSLGLDAVSGVRWASERQEELCAAGKADSSNRPGFVLSEGICIKDKDGGNDLNEVLNTVELALNGTAQKQKFKGDLGHYTTKVNTTAVITGSLKDVRSLGLQFNECSDVIGATDTTLAGTFPMQDANVVLNLNSKKCVKQ